MICDINTKKGAFLFLVQTWALTMGSHRSNDSLHQARFANACISHAFTLKEESIPDDIEQACEEYMFWQDQTGASKPAWITAEDGHGCNNLHYPWVKK
ncbi:MAG: hypothetical protein WC819_03310 [Parcubacteria group bacterium]